VFFGDTVQDTRQVFYDTWQKHRLKQPLSALEQQLVAVILAHPEYHTLLEQKDRPVDQAYFPEIGQTNPFLHMGLHMAIREQIGTNRPLGIAEVYHRLLETISDPHQVEHNMMDCLAESLWLAQRNQTQPNENDYLLLLNQL
jgi:hypothetical protein